MPAAWLEAAIAALAERHAQGRWHGLERPRDWAQDVDGYSGAMRSMLGK
jgi:hypothetical protein